MTVTTARKDGQRKANRLSLIAGLEARIDELKRVDITPRTDDDEAISEVDALTAWVRQLRYWDSIA